MRATFICFKNMLPFLYLLLSIGFLKGESSLTGTLQIDPLCSYEVKKEKFYLDCSYPSEGTNLSEILQEVSQFSAERYDITIRNHYYPQIEEAVFNNMPVDVLGLDQNGIEFISDQVFSQLDTCTCLYLSRNLLKTPFVINAPEMDMLFLASNQFETVQRKMLNLPKASSVIFYENRITTIEPDAFQDLLSIEALEFDTNRIKHLPIGLFKNLKTLQSISLTKNSIEEIKPDTFDGLDLLTSLNLEYNLIKDIDVECFKRLPSLQTLRLNNLHLSNLTGVSFYEIPQIEILYIGYNFIESITDDSFYNLVNLSTLWADHNLIEDLCSFTKQIQNAPKLYHLDVSFNKIIRIDSRCFEHFPLFNTLGLAHNKIKTIDSNAFDGVQNSLESLDLGSNKLQSVKQDYFNDLVFLKNLDLSDNQISTVQVGSFDKTSLLNKLDLSHNCLYRLDSSLFSNLPRLQTLQLSYNLLNDSAHRELFAGLKELNQLNLNNNLLSDIEGLIESADQLVNLNYLALHDNMLTRFNLASFVKIETLSLQNNRLSYLEFTSLPTLKQFDLSGNRIKEVYNVISLPSLYYLNLSWTSSDAVNSIVPIQLSSLSKLDISFIQDLDPMILFQDVEETSIKYIYMRRVGKMSSIAFLAKLASLATLDLSENVQIPIEEINSISSTCKSLDSLVLERLTIESLTQLDLLKMKSLTELNLNWNRVRKIKKLDLGISLNSLYLRGNRIRYIESKALTSLIELDKLDLSDNYLLAMEPLYGELAELMIFGNQLTTLPHRLNVVSLTELDLSNNQLTEISSFPTPMFRKLSLYNNKIGMIRNDTLVSLSWIEFISLRNNQIQTIEPNSFLALFSLASLDLSMNQIQDLDSLTLAGLVSLKALNLSHNQIESLDQTIFADLFNLISLDVSFNNLIAIVDNTFEPMRLLSQLRLNSNSNFTNLTGATLAGLDYALDYIQLDQEIINNPASRLILQNSLRAKLYPREVLGIKFYQSIDLVYSYSQSYTMQDCITVLQYIRVNLKLNLYTSEMMDNFLRDCISTDLSDYI